MCNTSREHSVLTEVVFSGFCIWAPYLLLSAYWSTLCYNFSSRLSLFLCRMYWWRSSGMKDSSACGRVSLRITLAWGRTQSWPSSFWSRWTSSTRSISSIHRATHGWHKKDPFLRSQCVCLSANVISPCAVFLHIFSRVCGNTHWLRCTVVVATVMDSCITDSNWPT